MTEEVKELKAKLMISGAFECRDKDGVLLKTIDFNTEVPVTELKESESADQPVPQSDA